MEKIMIVQQVEPDGTAFVCPETRTCAGSCESCPARNREERIHRFKAANPVGAKAGDRVTVMFNRVSRVMAIVRMYIMPVVLFLACYLLGEHLWGQGPLTGMGGLVLALILGTAYDRLIYSRKTKFTITGFAPKA